MSMLARQQCGATAMVVAACHVFVLCAPTGAERGSVVPADQGTDRRVTPPPLIWVAPLAPVFQGSVPPRRNSGKVEPYSATGALSAKSTVATPSPSAPHPLPGASIITAGEPTPTPTIETNQQDDGSGSQGTVAFLAADTLDQRPVAVSEPDIARLGVAPVSGLPVVLRVFVSRSGQVVRVEVIAASEDDTAFITELEAMLKATLFLPGKRGGVDVAAFFDVKLSAIDPAQSRR